MNGLVFKIIRKFNSIPQIRIAKMLGYKTKYPVLKIEKEISVPTVFVNALSQILKKDLTDEEVLKSIFEQIPTKYYPKRKPPSIFD